MITQKYVLDVTNVKSELRSRIYDCARNGAYFGQHTFFTIFDEDDEHLAIFESIKQAYPELADKLTVDNFMILIWW
jgi:hypothetical protein